MARNAEVQKKHDMSATFIVADMSFKMNTKAVHRSFIKKKRCFQ